jgi:hypothetical protein
MAHYSKVFLDGHKIGPNGLDEGSVSVTVPAGVVYTDVTNGGSTLNVAILAEIRGETGDGLGVVEKVGGTSTAVIAFLNHKAIAAGTAANNKLLSQFSEFGNLAAAADWKAHKDISLSGTLMYAGFDRAGNCLGINSSAATIAALSGFVKLVPIYPRAVLIDNVQSAGTLAAPTASTAAKVISITFRRAVKTAVEGMDLKRFYQYGTDASNSDFAGTAGKA